MTALPKLTNTAFPSIFHLYSPGFAFASPPLQGILNVVFQNTLLKWKDSAPNRLAITLFPKLCLQHVAYVGG